MLVAPYLIFHLTFGEMHQFRVNFHSSHGYKLTFNPQKYAFHIIQRIHLIMPLV